MTPRRGPAERARTGGKPAAQLRWKAMDKPAATGVP